MDPLEPGALAALAAPATGARGAQQAAPRLPFAQHLEAALSEANQTLHAAESSSKAMAGKERDLVEATIALSRADLSLRFVLSLRNRVLAAYQEVMRLQV